MGGEEFKWRTISYRASKDLVLDSKTKAKAYSSGGGMVSSGISDVVTASVHSEKTREEVDDYDYYNE